MATIFIATALFAAIRWAQLVVVVVIVAGKIFATQIFATQILATQILVTNVVAGKVFAVEVVATQLGRGRPGGFARRGAEIGKNGLLLNLTLAQCGEIFAYRFFFIQSNLAGVGAYETFIEDAAGKLAKLFVLEGAQHAGADFGDVGDGVERKAALLALFAKFFSERSQGRLRQAGVKFPSASRWK